MHYFHCSALSSKEAGAGSNRLIRNPPVNQVNLGHGGQLIVEIVRVSTMEGGLTSAPILDFSKGRGTHGEPKDQASPAGGCRGPGPLTDGAFTPAAITL